MAISDFLNKETAFGAVDALKNVATAGNKFLASEAPKQPALAVAKMTGQMPQQMPEHAMIR